MAGSETPSSARQTDKLALLVYLLQLLTVLFGITTVIAILVNHIRLDSVRGSPAESHFRWQILTFWVALAVFITGLLLGGTAGTYLAISAVIWLYYRALKGLWYLRRLQQAPTW